MKTSHRDPSRGAHRYLFLILALAFATVNVFAQAPSTPAPGQPAQPAYKIGTITVKFVGVANVNEQVVRANMAMKEGSDLDDTLIDRDIRSLYKTGLFEFIEVKREVTDEHMVNLAVEVTPKFRVLAIKFEGNKDKSTRRLLKEVTSKPNGPLDERAVKEDTQKVFDYYQKSGYNQATVNYAIERDRTTGFGTIIFKIKEGNKVRIKNIVFVGNDHAKARKLRKEMETSRWWIFSWLTGGGRLKDDQFEDDLDKLREYYRELGYLDVEIAQDKVQFDYPTPKKLVITINVVEGRQYKVGDIAITGNKIHPEPLLRLILRQKSGAIFTPSKLDKDVENLEDFYGRDGYLDTKVRLVRKPNLSTGNIDVEYQITESEKFNVESVNIEGNTKTKSTVILRELNLGPGEVFDTVRMKLSKLRLENTRFFEDVNISPETTNLPGRRNLKIAVKEGRTGNLTFGAGFSSLEKAVVFAELSQSNFDLFNRHSFFQGDGQKFRIRLSIGSVSSEAVIAFEEPWLFQQPLALGGQIYRTSSDYNSSFYQEIRYGVQIYLRKTLFERVEGQLAYTYEIVDIRNVTTDASSVIQNLSGKSSESRLSLTLTRDLRDKIINTTTGSRAQFLTELAGGPLGGKANYYRLEFQGAQFFPLFETQTQVLSIIGRAGVVQSFGNSNKLKARYNLDGTPQLDANGNQVYTADGVPFFDRYFLGGPQTLRGFEFRDVSPRDYTNEPVGGKSYGMFSAEYSLDIVSPIRFAIFYDAGFVNSNAYDFSPARYNDNFGFGVRLFVLGAPLSLDFGIPLTGDKFNKKGNQFNFSFGTRF
ncbi:MAG TPA: outer membrane protein assembly factor BamA [Opitutaceae bacterium]|nr:outer membrane protein assembly factor BamA [Opitutaceae bacterium]